MLKELKFVKGAISKKDFVPYMKHFSIENGRITAYNGSLTLSSPISLNINCKPKAETFIRAIENSEETIKLSMTDGGKLRINSGKFRALIECFAEETPKFEPEGIHFPIDGELLLEAFTTLFELIGTDASRPWSTGIMLKDGSALATNNVIIAEYWLGFGINIPINIPKDGIREVLRVKIPPTSLQVSENSITFHYDDGKWIKCQLLSAEWPDISPILNKPNIPIPITKELFEGLELIKHFCADTKLVYFGENKIYTSQDEAGASYDIDRGSLTPLIFNIEMFLLIKDIAETIDWEVKPCLFFGKRLRGAIIGKQF